MAVRQYIGARYVPKFYEGPNGSAWTSGVIYEPLTIVQYANNVYISKKTVPADIGSPNQNVEYWANIGIMGNVQTDIANLQTDVQGLQTNLGTLDTTVQGLEGTVDNLSDDVTDLDTKVSGLGLIGKKVDFFGDSITYGTTVNGGVVGRTTKPFPEWFAGLTGATVENHGVGGACMANVSGSWSFAAHVDDFQWSNLEYVVLMFGINDVGAGIDPVGTTVANGFQFAYEYSIERMLSVNPALKIVLCNLPYSVAIDYEYGSKAFSQRSANEIIKRVASKYNLPLINVNTGEWVNANNINSLTGDGLHFNDAGYKMLGEFIANNFNGNGVTGLTQMLFGTVTLGTETAPKEVVLQADKGWSRCIIASCIPGTDCMGFSFVTLYDGLAFYVRSNNGVCNMSGGVLGLNPDASSALAIAWKNTSNAKKLVLDVNWYGNVPGWDYIAFMF